MTASITTLTGGELMLDQRLKRRRSTVFYMKVHDTATNRLAGFLADITTSGMKLVSEEPLALGATYRLQLDLPDTVTEPRVIDLKAKTVWSRYEESFGFYDIGLEFLEISENGRQTIENPLAEYLFYE